MEDKPYSDQIIDYYEGNPFKELLPDNFFSEIISSKGNPLAETLFKNLLLSIRDLDICLMSQMIMSFLVSGIEENSRYPDHKLGTVPNEIYSEESEIIKNLSYFIERQKFCVRFLREYFKSL